MLFVVFQLGPDRYAIDARAVVEVLPLVQLKGIPQAPPGVAGLMNYRGVSVPVVDLPELALRRPAERCLSTRLFVAELPGIPTRLIGLIAEKATDTARWDPQQFTAAGVATPTAPYLGPVVTDADGKLVQWVRVEDLLPADLWATLLVQEPAAP